MTQRLVALLAPLALLACADERPPALAQDDMVALRASIDALEPVRAELPIEDQELEEMGIDFTSAAIDLSNCEREGIVSGVWRDASVSPLFQGSWFTLGTRDLGGTVDGSYGEGRYEGTATGSGIEATVVGSYDDGIFLGTWEATGAEGNTSSGELIGRYEHRNDYGGYFFGVWGHCR